MILRPQSVAILATALALAGCASDDAVGRFLVGSSNYTFYNCGDLAGVIKAKETRERELQGLMAKSSAGPAGGVVNEIAYRPDYQENHGELVRARSAAAEKNCPPLKP
jgi:hypothetical protein